MEMIVALSLMPCLAALLVLVARGDRMRDAIVGGFAIAIGAVSVAFAALYLNAGVSIVELPAEWSESLSIIAVAIELVVGIFVACYAVKYRRPLPLVLALIQIALAFWFELAIQHGSSLETSMRIDQLSVIMILIIGVVGSGICVYALGYMKDFQAHHPDQADRRPWFFALMFAFLSAMFNIVLADNLVWMYTAWEVTTLCSFLLIGYTKTDEAMTNAFRQIVMNMLGGIAFQVAIVYAAMNDLPLLFSEFLVAGTSAASQGSAVFALPVVLLAFAGMTKAAQMPFHTWLLGAMVAPTPTSALLHSSTMVKAGVFLLLRLAPLFLVVPVASVMVVLVGGLTFALCSFLAFSQGNAKRVLAYSTIANLGLISACAAVGTPEAVWAGIFLLIFHAVAKSLLFLCVGTAEHHIGSRNIEDMDELFERMPRLARFMMLGIMCMFVAPFGMLVSKWATLVSFATTGQVVLLILLAFGSAATFLFWGKWLGKLTGIVAQRESEELTVHRSEWSAIVLMGVLVVVACVFFPLISIVFVEPYLNVMYGQSGASIGADNLMLMTIIVAFIIVVLFGVLGTSKTKIVAPYMSGITVDSSHRVFRASMGAKREATSRNWYMENIFGEKVLDRPATIITAVIIVVCLVFSVVAAPVGSGLSIAIYAIPSSFNESWLFTLIGILAFVILGPVLGCLLDGLDRKITARMQGRVGPPLLQPYYDVRKLIAKDKVSVNTVEGTYVTCALVFVMVGGGVFFAGGNFLLCVFLVTLAALFFILAAYSSRSVYAEVGADREALQVMAYEPTVLLVAVCMFLTLGTFDVAGVTLGSLPMVVVCLPIFLALLFVLTIKLRKSPFDLSYSHHAHQELVKGMTTEMSGQTLAKVDIMHWCETVLFLGWVGMFFVWDNPLSIPLAIVVALAIYFFEIWIDNNFARVRWQQCLKYAWLVALIAGVVNVGGLVLYLVNLVA